MEDNETDTTEEMLKALGWENSHPLYPSIGYWYKQGQEAINALSTREAWDKELELQ